MLNLPHKGIAPDMLGEVRPLLGVVGLDKARQELEHTDVPDWSAATSSASAGARASSRAWSSASLARDDPPRHGREGQCALNGRQTEPSRTFRDAPYVLRHRIATAPGTSVDTVLLDAMSSVPTAVPPPVDTLT